ncbi:hypothetical protein BD289DRAFT_14144 [Coniella lustricola]|uniref:N-acetyltransferase domain-containing protein n=1 Tax=Coniella lustricola TaxID=2025994 RepID=A0A2T3A409_9PEZI|nr:hypothetical protein BD289DRAFT_14144 [Coniella lustricola]
MGSTGRGSGTSATTRTTCILEPVDFSDEGQCAELLRQREICGWAKTQEDIAAWREATAARIKSMFWIQKVVAEQDAQPPGAASSLIRIGHVSLDAEAEPPNLELANPHDRSVLTISRLFILPEHRKGGVGRAAVAMLEEYARQEPYGSRNCRTIAITTLSRRYCEEDAYRAEYLLASGESEPLQRGTSNEDWYARMGYVKWKDEPLYLQPMAGRQDFRLVAAYMRKAIA